MEIVRISCNREDSLTIRFASISCVLQSGFFIKSRKRKQDLERAGYGEVGCVGDVCVLRVGFWEWGWRAVMDELSAASN